MGWGHLTDKNNPTGGSSVIYFTQISKSIPAKIAQFSICLLYPVVWISSADCRGKVFCRCQGAAVARGNWRTHFSQAVLFHRGLKDTYSPVRWNESQWAYSNRYSSIRRLLMLPIFFPCHLQNETYSLNMSRFPDSSLRSRRLLGISLPLPRMRYGPQL